MTPASTTSYAFRTQDQQHQVCCRRAPSAVSWLMACAGFLIADCSPLRTIGPKMTKVLIAASTLNILLRSELPASGPAGCRSGGMPEESTFADESMLWALREFAAVKPAGTKLSLITFGLQHCDLELPEQHPRRTAAIGVSIIVCSSS